jgi:hypothetical protein
MTKTRSARKKNKSNLMKGKSKKVKIYFYMRIHSLIGANPCLTEYKLKKQSQFVDGKIDVSIYTKDSYGGFADFGRLKTNPIGLDSRLRGNDSAEGQNYSKKE